MLASSRTILRRKPGDLGLGGQCLVSAKWGPDYCSGASAASQPRSPGAAAGKWRLQPNWNLVQLSSDPTPDLPFSSSVLHATFFTFASVSVWRPANYFLVLSPSLKRKRRGSTSFTSSNTRSSNEPSFSASKAKVNLFAPLLPTTWSLTRHIAMSHLQNIGAMDPLMSACRLASTLPTEGNPVLSWYDFLYLTASERQRVLGTQMRSSDAKPRPMHGFKNTALPSLYHIYTA